MPASITATTYAYDAPNHVKTVAGVVSERGPPVVIGVRAGRPAVDLGSHGSLARGSDSRPLVTYDYDYLSRPGHSGSITRLPAEWAAGQAASPHSSLQPGGVAAETGTSALRGVDDVLSGLSKGKQSFVRTVPDEASLTRTFGELTEGGSPTTWKNFSGTVIERGEGVQVGLRSYSKSGGSTIYVRMPDGTFYRIHVGQ